jgi:hypothetical protein
VIASGYLLVESAYFNVVKVSALSIQNVDMSLSESVHFRPP